MKTKTVIGIIIAGIIASVIIVAVMQSGGNTPPPVTDEPTPGEPSPGIVVPTPNAPTPTPPIVEPTDPAPTPDLIIDVTGDPDSNGGNSPGNNPIQPPAKPQEPIPPKQPDSNNPPIAEPSPSPTPGNPPAQPPAQPAEPKQPEPDSGGVIIGDDTPKQGPYNCGAPNHKCDTPEKHSFIENLEINGCPTCKSHSCPGFYALNQWGFTQYTPSKCPEYSKAKDPVYTCQTCGKATGDGSNGTCVRFVNAASCPNCGVHVSSWTCHTCG